MRKYSPAVIGAIIFATFFSAHSAFAAGWTEFTSPTTNNLNGIDCGSASTCIAVGDSGTVVYTTNKITWTAGVSGVTQTLRDVDMISSTVGIAIGDAGTVIKTTDGGATWSTKTSGTTEGLYGIVMASSSVGWAVGNDGTVIKTANGGTTWSSFAPASAYDFRAVDATSTSVVWIVGRTGAIYRSTTGGLTWTDLTYSPLSQISTVDALTSSTAIIGGSGTFVSEFSAKTTDSGATWSSLGTLTGFDAVEEVVDFAFWTNTYGNVIGDMGTIANTSDGGTTWTTDTVTFSGSPVLTDSATPSAGVRYVVGEAGFIGFYDNYGPNAPTDLTVDGDWTSADYVSTTTPTLTWTAATDDEDSGVVYEYNLNSAGYVAIGNRTSYTLSALSSGAHTVELRAVDSVDNESDVATLIFMVDTTAPLVGAVTPTTATAGTSTLFVVYADDSTSDVDVCTLYHGTTAVASMTGSGPTWTATVTTSTAGTYSMYATCVDLAGNSTTGASVTLTVTGTTTTTEETAVDSDEAVPGDLIKLACDAGADVNDPCKAVYYFGDDGKRHAFPNEKVYFTWYADFDDVVIVTDDYMASLMLGRNVTYHPGTKMVKFITVNTVYVVGEDGKLRAIDTEATAKSIYGSTWNKQIDDISDAFFGNYKFGDVINSASDFDPDAVEASVSSIDDIL